MNYKETLNLVKSQNIDMITLMIAFEFDCALNEIQRQVNSDEFELLCNVIYNLWLKLENITIENSAKTVARLLMTKTTLEISEMNKWEIAEHINY